MPRIHLGTRVQLVEQVRQAMKMSASKSTFLTTSPKDEDRNVANTTTSKDGLPKAADIPRTPLSNSFNNSGVEQERASPLVTLLEVAEILGSFKEIGGRQQSSPDTIPPVESFVSRLPPLGPSVAPKLSVPCRSCVKSRSNFWQIVLGPSSPCCETCGKRQDNAAFNSHLPVFRTRIEKKTVPKKVKKHVCEICGARFSQRGGVNSHVRTVHLKQKRFQCEVEGCDRVFGHRGDATRHVRSFHEGLKPHNCTICGVGFERKSVLKRHRGNVHRGTSM